MGRKPEVTDWVNVQAHSHLWFLVLPSTPQTIHCLFQSGTLARLALSGMSYRECFLMSFLWPSRTQLPGPAHSTPSLSFSLPRPSVQPYLENLVGLSFTSRNQGWDDKSYCSGPHSGEEGPVAPTPCHQDLLFQPFTTWAWFS